MEGPVLMAAPSFRDVPTVHNHYHHDEDLNSSSAGFEFSFVPNYSTDTSSGTKAYPVFDRSLLHDEGRLSVGVSAPPSVPPSPAKCLKSSSTGSLGRRWWLRDLVLGRTCSDGKEKFAALGSPGPKESSSKAKEKKNGAGNKVSVDDAVAARCAKGKGSKGGRQSFLPYRPVLFGFFANRAPF